MRALSFDGGGVKGVLEARLIERLEARTPFLAHVDLFAGTSTGGFLALALAADVPIADCVALYEENAERIFAARGWTDCLAGSMDEYVRANYGQEGLRETLEDVFGDKRLGDLKRDVLIPTFDLVRFEPKFLDRSDDWSLVDSALATSAAPTHFPAHIIREGGGSPRIMVDGGIFANNPAKAAADYAHVTLGCHALKLLSIGAGKKPITPLLVQEGQKVLDWGFRQWLVKHPHLLVKALFEGSVATSHYSARAQLRESYHRVQPPLPEDVQMDDAGKVPLLKAVADGFDIEDTVDWIKLHMTRRAS